MGANRIGQFTLDDNFNIEKNKNKKVKLGIIKKMVQLDGFASGRFGSYKQGWGFGKSGRDYLNDPRTVRPGRASPQDDRFYASCPFDKTNWERGQANSMGFGDRPDYGKLEPSGRYFASPASYLPKISAARKDVVYKSLSLKSRPVEVARAEGPGPGKYDTRGDLTTTYGGVTRKGASIRGRILDTRLFRDAQFIPGPDAYNTRQTPGASMRPIRLKGRDKRDYDTTQKTPAPGEYEVGGDFSKYNLIPKGWVSPLLRSIA